MRGMRARGGLICVFVLATVSPARATLDLAAWLDASADAARLADVRLPTIYPVLFALRPDGRVEALAAPALRAWLPAARARGVRVLPTVQNLGPAGFDPGPVRARLADPAVHVAELVALAAPFDGLALDYEALGPEDAAPLASFVEALAAALHARGLRLAVAVPARTAEPPPPHALAWDLARIGRAADEVVVMAYDHAWPGGSPGPVAPLDWVLAVARYAKATVPPDRLRIALPLYGYDWGADTLPVPQRDLKQWIARRGGGGATRVPLRRGVGRTYARSYLDREGRPRWLYGDPVEATLEKARALRRQGIRRLAFWRAEYAADGLFERLGERNR